MLLPVSPAPSPSLLFWMPSLPPVVVNLAMRRHGAAVTRGGESQPIRPRPGSRRSWASSRGQHGGMRASVRRLVIFPRSLSCLKDLPVPPNLDKRGRVVFGTARERLDSDFVTIQPTREIHAREPSGVGHYNYLALGTQK